MNRRTDGGAASQSYTKVGGIPGGAGSSQRWGRVIPRRRPRRSSTVTSKLILPLIAGFSLCVAGAVAARAESTSSDQAAAQTTDSQTTPPQKKKKEKKHPNKTELDKLERGNPHSVYYKSRKKSAPNPTSAQIQAGETGNPASVDYANRKA